MKVGMNNRFARVTGRPRDQMIVLRWGGRLVGFVLLVGFIPLGWCCTIVFTLSLE